MNTEPTQDQLRDWWDGLSEAARAVLSADPSAAIPQERVDEVISFQNGITTFAR
jgi:hypothetical protein